MNIKNLITVGMIVMATLTASAEPTVSNETAKQRYPWNGLVDITCTVSGLSAVGDEFYCFSVEAVMPDSGNARNVSRRIVSHLWVEKNGTNSADRSLQANGSYRLLWDAKADLGNVIYSNMIMRVTINTFRDKVQLWEGGPYWAGKNIGAQLPWEYGYYFWWGDAVGYRRQGNAWVASDGSSSDFSFNYDNTPTCDKNIDTLKSNGWITADGVLAPGHDAAHVQWGGEWRMPTNQELTDLASKCYWTRTEMNGVYGWLVSGTGDYASNSIFLPAAGGGYGTSLSSSGWYGYYWSSVPLSDSDRAYYLGFDSGGRGAHDDNRSNGRSVRPVQGFAE